MAVPSCPDSATADADGETSGCCPGSVSSRGWVGLTAPYVSGAAKLLVLNRLGLNDAQPTSIAYRSHTMCYQYQRNSGVYDKEMVANACWADAPMRTKLGGKNGALPIFFCPYPCLRISPTLNHLLCGKTAP